MVELADSQVQAGSLNSLHGSNRCSSNVYAVVANQFIYSDSILVLLGNRYCKKLFQVLKARSQLYPSRQGINLDGLHRVPMLHRV